MGSLSLENASLIDCTYYIANTIPNVLQALEVIRELQKHFPIKRSPMRLRLTVPEQAMPSLLEKINDWNSTVVSREGSGSQLSVVSLLR